MHVKTVHEMTKLFNCDYCEYGTNRKAAMSIHIREMHSDDSSLQYSNNMDMPSQQNEVNNSQMYQENTQMPPSTTEENHAPMF